MPPSSGRYGAAWMTAALLLASAVVRICVFAGIDGVGVWRQIVWPVVAAVLFALIVLLAGKEMLYKTALPVWLMGICAAWQMIVMAKGQALLCVAACLCALLFCVVYTVIISGRLHRYWLLVLALLGFICLAAIAATVSRSDIIRI